jgi:hypothetical protein
MDELTDMLLMILLANAQQGGLEGEARQEQSFVARFC